jgi:phosphoribosyl 1,2-cyclic phosphodiesterase
VGYGGNTSCVELRADGEIIILDAGSGIRALGQSLAREFGGRSMKLTLLISHTHWDHIQGFPFFSPAYCARNKLRILGYEGARAGLGATLAGQMESPYFPIALKEMPGHIEIEELKSLQFAIGAVHVRASVVNHPGIAVGYRLETSAGSVVYLPDNEPLSERSGATRVAAGRVAALDPHLIEFVHGADVLIMDSQYDPKEYASHAGWGHGCVDDVVEVAAAADAKRLYLFHHDPGHDDRFITRMLARARRLAARRSPKLKVHAAREGERVVMRGNLR